jgi:phenylpropionate dioxygenase-like ring-hydroxylating dioxygenase large terminal subunit
MSRAQLIQMAKHNMAHVKAGTIDQEPEVFRVPASNYYDETRWQQEINQVFKRLPLMLALTAEMPNPGDYRAMEAVGMPLLLSRGEDGQVRAFVNMCRHRGSVIMSEGNGNKKRFTCPYHAWTYDQTGALVSVYAEEDFGQIDKSCHGLTPLPVAERAGLIWVILNPKSTVDINTFLSGYDDVLAAFGFETWHLHDRRTVRGPNWKVAYDGYMDLYHLPILHKATFGSQMPNQALYYPWGPHQRVSSPDPSLLALEDQAEDEWATEAMINGVWTIFPHISIASFYGGGRSVMISQLFPGETPQESYTVQNYVMEHEPTEEQKKEANEQFKLLEYVVQEEDYGTGIRLQKALLTGAMDHVLFGRNEGGGQRFHGWVDRIIEARDDDELNAMFAAGERPLG